MKHIASVGPDIPHDVLIATERYSGPLKWNVDRSFPHAEQWLESKFPLWAFSILEDWAAGAFAHLDTVVFSRGDDTAHRLYYYISELQRRRLIAGPKPLVFDVAKIDRSTSLAQNIDAVQKLASDLSVNSTALEQAVAETNTKRHQNITPSTHARSCLLAGSAPPDLRLHHIIEKAGWSAVGETLEDTWRRLGHVVQENTGDPIHAIGQQLYAAQIGPRAFYDRAHELLETVRLHAAKAVVLWYIEEDEAQIWHLPELRKALEAAAVPLLVLTRCSWRANDGVDAKITDFLKGLTP